MLWLVCTACAPALRVPTPLDAQRAHVDLSALQAGRTLYARRCGNCHTIVPPQRFAADVWPQKVQAMQERAHINMQERALIEQFLRGMCGAEK